MHACFTGVRLYLNGELANFTLIKAGDFTDISDVLWCQSANDNTNIGDWFFPNGTTVPSIDDDDDPLHVLRVEGQIALLRDLGVAGIEGLYRCSIPDENGVDQDLWIGIYQGLTYFNIIDSKFISIFSCFFIFFIDINFSSTNY